MSSEPQTTQTRILETAWRLLEEGGKVRMSDIAKAVGISRQALYLHFASRADLLIATTLYLDKAHDSATRLAPSRAATTGQARLAAYVEAWGNYIPEIQGVARALIAMQDTDPEARAAWHGRLLAIRDGFAAAVQALERDGDLREGLSGAEATDLLWALVSVETWVLLREGRGWSQARFIEVMQQMARDAVVRRG